MRKTEETIPSGVALPNWVRGLTTFMIDRYPAFSLYFLALVGFIGGFLLTRYRIDEDHELLSRTAASFDDSAFWFNVWTAAVAASTAYWFVIIPIIWTWLRSLTNEFRSSVSWLGHFVYFGLLIVGLGIIIGLPLVLAPSLDIDIPHYRFRGNAVAFVGFAAGLPAILGIILIYLAARDEKHWTSGAPSSADVSKLVGLRDNLQRFLLTLGISIGLAILTTGVLRRVILALNAQEDNFAFPPELIALYGLLFTVVMVLVYVPAHSALLHRGYEFAARIHPLHDCMDAPKALQQIKQQDEVVNQLRLGTSVLGDVKNGLVIFAPVLASLPTMLLR